MRAALSREQRPVFHPTKLVLQMMRFGRVPASSEHMLRFNRASDDHLLRFTKRSGNANSDAAEDDDAEELYYF